MKTPLNERELKIAECAFVSRLALLGREYGMRYRYELHAICENCQRILTKEEITRGFFDGRSDDFTTCCPKCEARFRSMLVCHDEAGEVVRTPFYSGDQILIQMSEQRVFRPRQFAQKYPAIYHLAIAHFGNLSRAFEKIGIAYQYEDADAGKEHHK